MNATVAGRGRKRIWEWRAAICFPIWVVVCFDLDKDQIDLGREEEKRRKIDLLA
jgi:hypothetical protein